MTVIPFRKREAAETTASRSVAPPLSPGGATFLSEVGLINADLTVNTDMVRQIAWDRANREYDACKEHGLIPDWMKIIEAETKRARDLAELMIKTRLAQREFDALPLQERVILRTKLKLDLARYGLGMPYDANAVQHYEMLLKEVREAAPDHPGLLLLDKLERGAP